MRTTFASHTTTAYLVVLSAALHAACHDTPTISNNIAPPPQIEAEQLVDQDTTPDIPDSLRQTVQFLPPFGPPKPPPPITNTTVRALTLTIQPLTDSSATPLATFTLDAPRTRNGPLQPLGQDLHTNAWLAQWTPPQVTTPTTLALIVRVADSVVQRTPFVLTPNPTPSTRPLQQDTINVHWQPTLDIRFFLLPPPTALQVVVEPGVTGTLHTGTTFYRAGQRVPYRFTAQPGYTNVLVMIDDAYASNPGAVTMSSNHTLIVSADRTTSIDPHDAALVRTAHDLLTARDAPAAAQRWLDALDNLTDTTNLDERLAAIANAAFDPIADSAKLRRLNAALATHVFTAGSLIGHTTTPPPTPPPQGGQPTNRVHPSAPTRPSTSTQPRATRTPNTHPTARYTTSTPLAEEPATLAFVNGIFTQPLDALNATNTLLRVANATTFRTAAPITVRLLYNRSALADDRSPSATLSRCFSSLTPRLALLGVNSLPIFIAKCTGRAIADVIHNIQDLQEAARQYINISLEHDAPEPDARAFADSTAQWRDKGQHVIFVPHSQGNMMVQQAVQLLRQTHRYDPPHDSTCIGAVSLAAPLSTNWPITPPHLAGIVVDGDIILALQGNHFPTTHTATSDSATADIKRWNRIGAPLIAAIKRITWGIKLHNVVNSYLDNPTTQPIIQSSLATSLASCTLGNILLTPAALHLTLGDSAVVTSQLIDANDTPLDGTRTVQWSLSANIPPAVVRADQTSATIFTNAIGTAGIRAATSSRATTAALDIAPRPLQLDATETLWSRYYMLWWTYTHGTLGVLLPQWIDAPAWDGGSCGGTLNYGLSGSSAIYGQVCFAGYQVTVPPVPDATRYEARFFILGSTSDYAPVFGTDPRLTLTNASPYLISWSGVPPDKIDRIIVLAYDAAGRVLGDGYTCVHGCLGWPSN